MMGYQGRPFSFVLAEVVTLVKAHSHFRVRFLDVLKNFRGWRLEAYISGHSDEQDDVCLLVILGHRINTSLLVMTSSCIFFSRRSTRIFLYLIHFL